MKGIILAGGSGSRLFPVTISVTKQLLPVYDKPMIYYPLSTLIEFGINEILVISTKMHYENFKTLLKDGSQWGIKISYAIQEHPNGIAEAFLIGEKFINKDPVALILGDNIFYGSNFSNLLNKKKIFNKFGAYIFGYQVPDPNRYGVLEFYKNKVLSIEEKPKKPKSNYAVTGLYFYDNSVIKKAKLLKPSKRKELEITDLNNLYIKEKKLNYFILDEGSVWLDAGTTSSLLQSSFFVQTIQERQQILIGSPEKASFKSKFISKKKLNKIASNFPSNSYGDLLKKL